MRTITQTPSYRLKIEYDDETVNPRVDYDNFGHMACWHSRYNLGDTHEYSEPGEFLKDIIRDFADADEVIQYVKSGQCPDVTLEHDRSNREWVLKSRNNAFEKWFTEYTFSPKTINGSDMVKECILECLPMKDLKNIADENNVITLNLNDSNAVQTAKKQAIFSDTSINAWYYPHMEMLVEKGGINGYADGTFKPDNIITNAEFVKVIVGLVGGDIPTSEVHWADGYIQKAKTLGIVEADELPLTDYDEPIRRQTMAKYAARTMNKVLGETPTENTSEYTAEIKDWSDVCEACKPYVAEVYSKGIICGMPDGSFSGASYTTRAEAATMLVRMIDKSYRVKMYSGVAFNDTTDVLPDGKMSVEKSKDFMDITLGNLKFYKENGKYYVSGTFPELPDRFENWLTIDIERNDNQPVISFTTGFTMIEEQKISSNGSFVREIGIPSPDKINFIHIKIGVEAADNIKTNSKSVYYNILSSKQNEVTCIVNDSSEANKRIQYDFSKLFAW